jgi:hypothetical protein
MAETYPLTMPDFGIASVEFAFVNVTPMVTSPFTLATQAQRFKGGRFEATVTFPPMKRDQAEDVISFLLRLKGRYGTFLLGDPAASTARGAVSGDAGTISMDGYTVLSDLDAGSDEMNITTTGMTTQSDYVKAGDYFQIGTGANARLHKVVADADLASSDTTIKFHPETRKAYYNEELYFTSAKGVFRLDSDSVNWSVNNASIYGLSFRAVEVI